MELHTLVATKASPQDVLDILRDQHRHLCGVDPEADPDIELTFDTTVGDWRDACDLLNWRRLARALNDYWNTDITLREWKIALTPPERRTLRDVCDLLAVNATIENVAVPSFFGRQCPPTGVFFAVRELLRRDGADVSRLRPSTPLAQFAIRHETVFCVRNIATSTRKSASHQNRQSTLRKKH